MVDSVAADPSVAAVGLAAAASGDDNTLFSALPAG